MEILIGMILGLLGLLLAPGILRGITREWNEQTDGALERPSWLERSYEEVHEENKQVAVQKRYKPGANRACEVCGQTVKGNAGRSQHRRHAGH